MKWVVATDRGFIDKDGTPQECPSNIMIFNQFGFVEQNHILHNHTDKRLSTRTIKENGTIEILGNKVIINNPGEEETSLSIPEQKG
jgi:hypothetical protein